MGLEKAIIHGKEHRKPYRGSKAIDRTCRNHKGCPFCEGNRLYKVMRRKEGMDRAMAEYGGAGLG